ncbi:60S ribosomal protein L16A [Massospora cicadina]|nr:60S ribosomal protein L16A [Massospora cicadina]
MSTFEKVIVIDGKGHLLGRLASIVAKQALSGQRVVVVRCEEINISGSLFRNKEDLFISVLHLACSIVSLNGMVPHKITRGALALDRIKLFEGIPPPYDKMKRMVVPAALRVLRLKPARKYTTLNRLASEVGWKYQDVVAKLEEKRKIKSQAYYERIKAVKATKAQIVKNEKIEKINAQLKEFGY